MLSATLLLATGILVAGPAHDNAARKDLNLLQGVWQFVSMEGDKGPPPDLKKLKLTFKGNKLSHTGPGGKTVETTIKLDPSKKPKEIDITSLIDKETLRGIYSIDGDTLKICGPRVTDGDRPTEFKGSEGVDLIVLKRVMPTEADIKGIGDKELDPVAIEFLKTGREFTTILKTVTDKKTAEDATARLISVFKRLGELEQKVNRLSPAQQRLMEVKHGKEMASLLPAFMKESTRLQKLPGVLEVFRGTPLFSNFFGQPPGE